MYLGFVAFLGFLPVYAKAGHLNDGQSALVVGTQLLTALVAKPAAGWLSDRIGRKPVITVGLVVSAASLPLIFRAEGFLHLLLFAPILGIGVGAVTPVQCPGCRSRQGPAARCSHGGVWPDIGCRRI